MESVIFDFDGTLVDSLPGIEYSVDQAQHTLGYPPRKGSLQSLIGPPIRQILSAVSGERDRHALDRLEDAFRKSYDSEGWRRTTLHPGARETLGWLAQAGSRVFLLTNKPDQATARILANLELQTAFDRVLCRDSVEPPFASKGEMLRALISMERISRADSLMVGDTVEDLRAAQSNNIPVAVVKNGYGEFRDPPSWDSCYILEELRGLRSLFATVGGIG